MQPTQQRAQGRGESAYTALKRERERRVAVVWLGASERSGLAEPGWRAPTLARRRGAPRPTGRDATCAMRRDDPTRDRRPRAARTPQELASEPPAQAAGYGPYGGGPTCSLDMKLRDHLQLSV